MEELDSVSDFLTHGPSKPDFIRKTLRGTLQPIQMSKLSKSDFGKNFDCPMGKKQFKKLLTLLQVPSGLLSKEGFFNNLDLFLMAHKWLINQSIINQ